eukprot:82703-Rhodomonas_salina.1
MTRRGDIAALARALAEELDQIAEALRCVVLAHRDSLPATRDHRLSSPNAPEEEDTDPSLSHPPVKTTHPADPIVERKSPHVIRAVIPPNPKGGRAPDYVRLDTPDLTSWSAVVQVVETDGRTAV